MTYEIDGHIVEITNPFGGGDCYQVMVDNYYCGIIAKYKDGWQGRLTTELVQGDDICELLEAENRKARN